MQWRIILQIDYTTTDIFWDRHASLLPLDFQNFLGQNSGRQKWAGVSSGAFVSSGYGSFYPQEVCGIINFSGGKKPVNANNVRDPRLLIRTVGDFGKTSRVPTLWLYAADDDIFDPPMVQEMFAEYQQAGGKGTLHILPPRHGHQLFVKGMEMWVPLVNEFLKEINPGR